MIDNWAEVRRRRLVRLRAGAIAGIALVVAIGAVSGTLRDRGESTSVESKAPGYREQDAAVDTSPFSLALPQSDGPTTLPDSVFDPTATTPSTTLPPSTTTLPPPTTTLPPTTTTLPIPGRQGDPICDGFVELITFGRSGLQRLDEPQAVATEMRERLAGWIRTIRGIDAERYATVIDKLEEVRELLGDSPSGDELRVILSDLLGPDDRTEPLRAYAMEVCPEVLAAR